MEVQDILLLAKYNAAANKKMGEHLLALSAAEWNRSFDAYFPSIAALCGHILDADQTWLWRFSDRVGGAWTQLPFVKNYAGEKHHLQDPGQWALVREQADQAWSAFAAALEPGQLAAEFSHKRSDGQLKTGALGHFVLHVFNHQTHHRGMVSLFLELMGHENDFNSLSAAL